MNFVSAGSPPGRRASESKPPLLLIHGYPECHVMWHRVAPPLAEKFTLVIPDLPGYGWSAVPESNLTAAQRRARAAQAIACHGARRRRRVFGGPNLNHLIKSAAKSVLSGSRFLHQIKCRLRIFPRERTGNLGNHLAAIRRR